MTVPVDTSFPHPVDPGLAIPGTTAIAADTANTTTTKDEIITRPPSILSRSSSSIRPPTPPPSSIHSDNSSNWTIAWSNEMPDTSSSSRCSTRWIARVLPFIILALFAYATYDVIVYCGVQYFIQKTDKTATGIVLIVLYSVLLLLTAAAYIRCYVTVQYNPGFVPWTPQREAMEQERKERASNGAHVETPAWAPRDIEPDSPGLEAFYSKDVFICEIDGQPKCLRLRAGQSIDARLILVMALGGFFGLFTVTMTGTALRFAIQNITNVDLYRKSQTFRLAVRVPTDTPSNERFNTITYPLQRHGEEPRASGAARTTGVPQANGAASTQAHRMAVRDQQARRTFAILQAEPGENPWHVGYLRNFKSVMGNSIIEWLLPIRHSPCSHHDSMVSDYEFGPLLEKMKKRYGIEGMDPEKSAAAMTSN
ncbi:hypothetical protein IL306_014669 [Fusarium sp. DS 682]|nr:hypothetical protein IL306_014669 [Fusarium sp. DS 682]